MRNSKVCGYPPEYLRSRRRFAICFLAFLFVVGAFVCFLVYNAIYSDVPLVLAAGAGGFFLYWLLVFYIIIKSRHKLALYFEAKVPGSWVWSAALARNCVYLDELCEQANVADFSSFGFTDELSGKNMLWHAPAEGLETIQFLMRRLRTNPAVLEETGEILSDLQKMSDRLQEAEVHGVRFCFLLHEGSINAMEVEQRCGQF